MGGDEVRWLRMREEVESAFGKLDMEYLHTTSDESNLPIYHGSLDISGGAGHIHHHFRRIESSRTKEAGGHHMRYELCQYNCAMPIWY